MSRHKLKELGCLVDHAGLAEPVDESIVSNRIKGAATLVHLVQYLLCLDVHPSPKKCIDDDGVSHSSGYVAPLNEIIENTYRLGSALLVRLPTQAVEQRVHSNYVRRTTLLLHHLHQSFGVFEPAHLAQRADQSVVREHVGCTGGGDHAIEQLQRLLLVTAVTEVLKHQVEGLDLWSDTGVLHLLEELERSVDVTFVAVAADESCVGEAIGFHRERLVREQHLVASLRLLLLHQEIEQAIEGVCVVLVTGMPIAPSEEHDSGFDVLEIAQHLDDYVMVELTVVLAQLLGPLRLVARLEHVEEFPGLEGQRHPLVATDGWRSDRLIGDAWIERKTTQIHALAGLGGGGNPWRRRRLGRVPCLKAQSRGRRDEPCCPSAQDAPSTHFGGRDPRAVWGFSWGSMEEGEIASEEGEILAVRMEVESGQAEAQSGQAEEQAGQAEARCAQDEDQGEGAVGQGEKAQHSDPFYCPVLHFDPSPQRIYHMNRQFKTKSLSNNFFKGVKWSPDGSCFLTCSEDKSIRLFDLPANVLETEEIDLDSFSSRDDSLQASLMMFEGETVYDLCWYPHMNASDPATCVFATTTRDHPVHLWDAATGQLRCTYRAYDAMDEITAALSIAFNPTGSRLFCGYNKKLRIFETSRPGRQFEEHSTLTRSKEGITGIVSALAFNNHNQSLLAAGSYDRSIAVYNEANMELLYTLHGHEGGVTQLQFSKDGNYLYSGARKDPHVFCWDVRYTTSMVYKLERCVASTNQRISFDIEPYGKHLGTGGEDGHVRIFDLQSGELVTSIHAASDTINGFSFHPSYPLAATTSGQRRFGTSEDEEPELTVQENCASIWRFSCSWVEYMQ